MGNDDIIPEREASGKPLLERWFIPLSLLLITVISFGFGRLSQRVNPEPVKILSPASVQVSAQTISIVEEQGSRNFVASKNGKKYYPLSCSGAGRIKEGNKVYFDTQQEAEDAGYSKAANCSF